MWEGEGATAAAGGGGVISGSMVVETEEPNGLLVPVYEAVLTSPALGQRGGQASNGPSPQTKTCLATSCYVCSPRVLIAPRVVSERHRSPVRVGDSLSEVAVSF